MNKIASGFLEEVAEEIRRDTKRNNKSKGASAGVLKTAQALINACFLDFCGGLSLDAIALRKGIPIGTIRAWSRRYLWSARKNQIEVEQRAKKIIEKANCDNTKSVPSVQIDLESEESRLADYARKLPFDISAFKGKPRGELAELYEERMSLLAMRFVYAADKLSDDAIIAQAAKIKSLDEVARKALGLEDKRPSHIINIGLLTGGIPPAMPLPPMSSNVPILSDVTPEKAVNLSDSEPLPSVD